MHQKRKKGWSLLLQFHQELLSRALFMLLFCFSTFLQYLIFTGFLLDVVWFSNLIERNGSVTDSENRMAPLYVWKQEQSSSIFCLVTE
jgi:hypothetical protein